MAKYRKVDTRIWNDAKFRSLSDNGKLAFFFLLTHPHMTAIGAMRSSIPGLAAEIGWTTEAFRKAFQEATDMGMAEHDEKASLIWLPNFVRYNPPESPNVVKAWAGALEMLPECSLLNRVVAGSVAFAQSLNKGFAEALPEAFAKSMPYQEPEQEQEQDKVKDRDKPPASQATLPPAKKSKEKGTRLSADWLLPRNWAEWALKEFPVLHAEDIRLEADKFRDYWISVGGAKGVKLDWGATWRNWIRRVVEDRKGGKPSNGYNDSLVAAGKAIFGDLSHGNTNIIEGESSEVERLPDFQTVL